MRILVCGQQGSGKTTFGRALAAQTGANFFDGDEVRQAADDWDFSDAGRLRQAQRMHDLTRGKGVNVASFICPNAETRNTFSADLTVWMDTKTFDGSFTKPTDYHHVNNFDDKHVTRVIERIPQAVMIGRFQPWHDGHMALFLEAFKKYGYVNIQVRSMPYGPSNPYTHYAIRERIKRALIGFEGCYRISSAPNVQAIVYGRDVGYAIDQIQLPADIEAISATAIRREA